MFPTTWLLFGSFIVAVNAGERFAVAPPPPKFPKEPIFPNDVGTDGKAEDLESAWERSGLFEGDIAMPPNAMRNVIFDPTKRWKFPIPVYINQTEFTEDQVTKIEEAMQEIEGKTCAKFSTWRNGDDDYVVVRSNKKGCWSSVGRQDGGQVINLQQGGCIAHGTIVHEFLHTLGLYHQQSTAERDDYVTINFCNIKPGKSHNFKKYPSTLVTSYNLTYDYGSVMHYSAYAFSRNGERTIIPKKPGVELGQRVGMSDIDSQKIQIMYNCSMAMTSTSSSTTENIIDSTTVPTTTTDEYDYYYNALLYEPAKHLYT